MRQCFSHYRSFLSSSVFALSIALLLSSGGPSLAQSSGQRADIARTQTDLGPGVSATGEVDGHAAPSPNDADLGEQAILKRSDRYQPFTATAVVPCYWTSNVALTNSHEQDDFLVAPAVGLSYQPRITNTLYGLASVREQLFYYDTYDALNFGSFDAEAGLIYIVPQWHNMVLRGEFIYNRLTDKNSFSSFFNNYSIFVAAELPIRIDRAQTVAIGVDANISVDAKPEPPRRNDYDAYISYSVNLTRSFSFDAVGRIVTRTYQLTDRVDVSEVLAATASYKVTDFLTASAISTLAANQSNYSVFDYKVANVGGLLSLSVKF
jgi:hypothetical protein